MARQLKAIHEVAAHVTGDLEALYLSREFDSAIELVDEASNYLTRHVHLTAQDAASVLEIHKRLSRMVNDVEYGKELARRRLHGS